MPEGLIEDLLAYNDQRNLNICDNNFVLVFENDDRDVHIRGFNTLEAAEKELARDLEQGESAYEGGYCFEGLYSRDKGRLEFEIEMRFIYK